jgi:membrane-associated protease RseP (regulator of RpoE activity)
MGVVGRGLVAVVLAAVAAGCGSLEGSPGPFSAYLGTNEMRGSPTSFRYEPDGRIVARKGGRDRVDGAVVHSWKPDLFDDFERFGIEVADLPVEAGWTPFVKGAPGPFVTGVLLGGPAYLAGLRRGDVVLAVDGEPPGDAADLARRLRGTEPGARVTLHVRGAANGDEHEFSLEAGDDLQGETRYGAPLIRYRHEAARTEFRLVWGMLFHRYAGWWATREREPAHEVHWGALLDLFEVHATPEKTEVTLLWLIYFRW